MTNDEHQHEEPLRPGPRPTHPRRGATRAALALALAAAMPLAFAACDSSVGGNGDGGTADDGTTDDDGLDDVLPESIDAVDVLLVVDGSGSMADKQAFLADTFRPFLERLASPRCVDAAGIEVPGQPAAPTDPCPAGSVRQYTPDVTVHVGVVSSSLGAGQVCNPSMSSRPLDDEGGRLASRSPGSTANDLPTYEGLGFFTWDPAARLAPAPGEPDFEVFAGLVTDAIRGVGEQGCGFEMPLEAMFRFLAEPHPVLDGGGVDEVLVAQRTAFLRDRSLLSVILLSDENDASMTPELEGFAASNNGTPMPRARAECASNPNDACCVSCVEDVPAGCAGDGGCAAPGDPAHPGNYHDAASPESSIYLRTWDSKRRFGVDVLHPVERYVAALTSPTVPTSLGTEEPNPVFAGGRDPRHVVYTAIVGVPWQDLAVDVEDLSKGFQGPREMRDRGTWDVILGDPAANVPPTDPHMIESPLPRPGIVLFGQGDDPINGGERDTEWTDLQYACVFDLPTDLRRDCEGATFSCDCVAGVVGPLCAASDPHVQFRAKAYPGVRQLDVAERLGDRGRVVSLCGLRLADDAPDPGTLGTIGLEVGLRALGEDIALRMSNVAAE